MPADRDRAPAPPPRRRCRASAVVTASAGPFAPRSTFVRQRRALSVIGATTRTSPASRPLPPRRAARGNEVIVPAHRIHATPDRHAHRDRGSRPATTVKPGRRNTARLGLLRRPARGRRRPSRSARRSPKSRNTRGAIRTHLDEALDPRLALLHDDRMRTRRRVDMAPRVTGRVSVHRDQARLQNQCNLHVSFRSVPAKRFFAASTVRERPGSWSFRRRPRDLEELGAPARTSSAFIASSSAASRLGGGGPPGHPASAKAFAATAKSEDRVRARTPRS